MSQLPLLRRPLARAFLLSPVFAVSLIGAAPEPLKTSSSLDPPITAALTYLAAQQRPDGSFLSMQPLTTTFHSTAKVAEVTQPIATAAAVFAGASGFLAQATPTTLEQRARRLFVAASSGDVAAILAGQNSDGGFGSNPGFSSDVLDTSLALAALRLSGQPVGAVAKNLVLTAGASRTVTVNVPPDATALEILVTAIVGSVEVRIKQGAEPGPFDPYYVVQVPNSLIRLQAGNDLVPGLNYIQCSSSAGATLSFTVSYFAPSGGTAATTAAVNYLLSARNSNGGWGFQPADQDSRLYYTHWAWRALAGIAVVDAPTTYVLSKQVTGSGFADQGAANDFDTAVALRTLAYGGVDPRAAAPDGMAFLLGRQMPDGSFDSDPFRTAWAIGALDAVRNIQPTGPTPGQVAAGLRLSKGPGTTLTLSWTPSCSTVAAGYAIYEGQIGHWYNHTRLDCLDDGADLAETVSPASGNRYYLVVALDGSAQREGSYGLDSHGNERPPGSSQCAIWQVLGACPPPVDYSIVRGGSATGFRSFTAASSVLDQAAYYTETQIGVPPGVTYTTTGVTRVSPTSMRIDFRIAVATGTATGIYSFQVQYGLLNVNQQPLGPLSGNLFSFRIEVLP